MRGVLGALVLALLLGACNSGPPPISDGLDDYRFRSNGPVWGTRSADGRLRTLWWDVEADDSGEVTAERAVLRLLGADLGIFDPDLGTRIVGSYPIGPSGTVTIFQLVHAGIDVWGAEIRIVRVGDRIRFVSARIPPPILLDVEPMVDPGEAAAAVGEGLGLMMTPPATEPELVVWDSALVNSLGGTPVLAWKMEVAFLPTGGTAFVSAVSGNLLQIMPGREAAAEVYFVRQSDDHLDFTTDGVREHWFSVMDGPLIMDPPMAEPAATNWREAQGAFDHTATLEAWFMDRFGWEGYDDRGSRAPVFVGYAADCPTCPSGFWCGVDCTARDPGVDPFAEIFMFSTGAYSSDVFTHEYTHAILDHVTGLDPVSIGESGAVEESLADTFAALVDTDSPWIIGDDLPVTSQRDLRIPADNDLGPGCMAQPEHLDERHSLGSTGLSCDLLDPGECVQSNDQICLGGLCLELATDGYAHCDSSIPSLAAYRFVQGDEMLDIAGVGVEKAAVVYFTALRLVGRWETFRDLRDHLLASCLLWASEPGTQPVSVSEPFAPEDCADLINAFHSVGLGAFPDSDRDGWDDLVDNCTMVPNFDQADTDEDRVGDACEEPEGG